MGDVINRKIENPRCGQRLSKSRRNLEGTQLEGIWRTPFPVMGHECRNDEEYLQFILTVKWTAVCWFIPGRRTDLRKLDAARVDQTGGVAISDNAICTKRG